jgi:putative molybdopterin biosynthesis protein
VHRLQLHYTFDRDTPGHAGLIRNPLLDLLHAVQVQGSISAAARTLGFSYRHVWGELKRWENELGHELIVWEKGQAARLTGFGNKLLWAERQVQARLAPQIDTLHADLARAFAMAFDEKVHVLTLFASHDDALSALRHFTASLHALQLDIRFTGSVDAIRALNEGRCVMAGFHTLREPIAGSLAQTTYKPLLKPGLHKIIGFAQRSQGLMLTPGNPLGLHSLADVVGKQARYANRALGTGTRLLLDELLARQGLKAQDVLGYEQAEPSHSSVAHAIASGQAETGLGIEAAARARGLDFLPLAEEDYHLVCLKSSLAEPAVKALTQVLQSHAWREEIRSLPGYKLVKPESSGQVLSLRQILPWWRFRTQKSNSA